MAALKMPKTPIAQVIETHAVKLRTATLHLEPKSLQLPAEGFARLPTILSVVPVSKSTWWNGVTSGRFPKPIKLGPKMTVWRVEDIRKLIANAGFAANDATV